MNSTPLKPGWLLSATFSFVLACLFVAGCASRHIQTSSGTAAGPKPPTELVTVYSVPFT